MTIEKCKDFVKDGYGTWTVDMVLPFTSLG